MRKNSGGVLGELLRRRNVLLAESHERQAEYRGAGDG